MQNIEFKRWIKSVAGKFSTSKTLLQESKNDPPEEPYRSKYKAKDILSEILQDLEKNWDVKHDMQIAIAWAVLKYELGVIALETEEYSLGCENLAECLTVLEEFNTKPECCMLTLNVLNQLGIVWSGRGEPKKALSYLSDAEKIYQDCKNNCAVCPSALDDIFKEEEVKNENWAPFEKTFTLTLYYLAQVYEHLNESEKSAKYCHMTLKRQLESEAFEEKEWSVNCATLSQYYIQEKMFVIARHLLACSTHVITKYESSIDNRVDDEDVWDDIRRSKAEIAWCWLKYCINLLSECQTEVEFNKTESVDTSCKLLSEVDVSQIEEKVICTVFTFEDARKVFLFGQNQIKEAKLYYTLSDHANNHVQLIQDHSKLYKNLIFYESDASRQCKMHKRRIDLLENVLRKLNPQYYLSVCRQLRFELGETYYELIDLKLKILNSSGEGMVLSSVKKVNSLISHAVDHFKAFIDSFKDRNGTMPDEFEDDIARPFLIAHFYLGGLAFKLIESDPTKKLQNLKDSEDRYKYILDYVEKNPSQAGMMEKELPVVKDMIDLMPERVIQVAGSTVF